MHVSGADLDHISIFASDFYVTVGKHLGDHRHTRGITSPTKHF
jgi:hypothetical protein